MLEIDEKVYGTEALLRYSVRGNPLYQFRVNLLAQYFGLDVLRRITHRAELSRSFLGTVRNMSVATVEEIIQKFPVHKL